MHEIYANPLTLEKLAPYMEAALETTGADGYQRTLHLALRNCIWGNNITCMRGIFGAYDKIDLGSVYSRGSLIHYAASIPILAQGVDALAPFELLLEQGADPFKMYPYHLFQDDYRTGHPTFQGNVAAYLQNLRTRLTTIPIEGRLASVAGKPEKTIKSIDYCLATIARHYPLHTLAAHKPLFEPADPATHDYFGMALDEAAGARTQGFKPYPAALSAFTRH